MPQPLPRVTRQLSLPHSALRAALAGLVGIAVFLAAPSARAASAAPVATVIEQRPDAVIIRLETPAVEWRGGNRYIYPVIPGFGTLGDKDRPALPVRIEHVAIPGGSRPTLEVLEAVEGAAPPGTVGPVQTWIPVLPGDTDLVPFGTEDPTVYGADDLYPADQPVRLGALGALREQPFVELVFTPVLHSPGTGRSIVYRSVTVRVDFGMVAPVSAPSEDDGFESTYDLGLVNAQQARAFRGTGGGTAPQVGADLGTGDSSLTVLTGGRYKFGPLSGKYKLVVNRDGIYRLGPSWIATNAPALAGYNPATWRLDCLGQQVPMTVVDANADGTFNGSDYVEFFGQALAWDILSPDEWNGGDYTDDNVYWLYADSGAVLRIPGRVSAPVSGYPIPADFQETVHHEVNNRFQPLVPHDGVDHWYEDPPLRAPASGTLLPSATYTVNTPGVSSATATASIKVRLLGDLYVNNLHRSAVQVNGAPVSGPSNWDGWSEFTHGVDDGPATFPQSLLRDANPASAGVTVTLPFDRVPPPGTTINLDVAYQNWIELTYGRQFRVDTDVNGDGTVTDDQMLIFSVPNQAAQIHVTGLGQPAAAIYEITKTLGGTPLASPVRITGAVTAGAVAPYTVDFELAADGTLPAGTVRRFAVATVTASAATGDLAPASVRADVDSNLHSPATGADWLVIANASFLDAGLGSAWQQLVAKRAAQGLRTRVVDVEDVYDEFSYGIQDPEAIRSFIAYVYANWPRIDPAVPLKYVLLLGDASYDFKNGMGNAQNRNLLSTYPRTVSQSTVLGWMSDETYFSTVSGSDSLPDVYLGRWPVHSVAETNAIAQKVLNYESASAPASYQSWMSDVVFLADDEAAFEEVQNQQILDYLLGTAHTWHKTYEGRVGASTGLTGAALAAEVKDRIQRQLNGTVEAARDIGPGAALVSYVGHGSWQNWGSGFSFFATATSGTDDLSPVTNGAKLPLVLVADCLAGGFAVTSNPSATTDLTYAICDDFLDTANKGAVGFIAPSHLTYTNEHTVIEGAFFEEAYGPRKVRNFGALTSAIQSALSTTGSLLSLRSYALFGDPAVNLIVPAPRPPTNVTATAGNHQVSLSWTASADAASYNVYQASAPGAYYYQVAAQVSGTAYTVTALENCTPYYYAVTSVDGRGFEGTRSTFNAGCGSGGACLTATPGTAAAPAPPAGLTATDAESGGTVLVQWTPSPASEDVREYRLYWGTTPGTYTGSLSAGYATSWPVGGLTNGVTYYFAVSGVNCSHGEGSKSTPIAAVPRRIEGIKPPNSVGDLRVFRSPDPGDHVDDARLQWTPVTVNIYGQATTVVRQEIYAGATPNFKTDAAHRLATINDGVTGTWIHENGFGDAGNHYYLVVSVDAAGNASGSSNDLPKGIDALTVKRTGGSLQFSWPAVSADVDGRRTVVASYTLYGRSSPFRRADLATVGVVATGITAPSVSLPVPAGPLFCYSVIAVDNRGALSPW